MLKTLQANRCTSTTTWLLWDSCKHSLLSKGLN